jgi:hypothetical protein
MCLIITCEACIYKDQASPCPMSQNNPKCVFYTKPSLRDKKPEPPKKSSNNNNNNNDDAYKNAGIPL